LPIVSSRRPRAITRARLSNGNAHLLVELDGRVETVRGEVEALEKLIAKKSKFAHGRDPGGMREPVTAAGLAVRCALLA
jgi:hypothetical protein